MNHSLWLATTLVFGLGSVSQTAWANTPEETTEPPTTMEEVVVIEPQRSANLTRIAEQINRQLGAEEEDNLTTIDSIIPDGFLDGLVDENGEVNLPLGLTVYDAMGTTSIGFGSKF